MKYAILLLSVVCLSCAGSSVRQAPVDVAGGSTGDTGGTDVADVEPGPPDSAGPRADATPGAGADAESPEDVPVSEDVADVALPVGCQPQRRRRLLQPELTFRPAGWGAAPGPARAVARDPRGAAAPPLLEASGSYSLNTSPRSP